MNFKEKYFVGWDIGGAHLKAVLVDQAQCVQQVVQLPCPLWQGMEQLSMAVDRALAVLGIPKAIHAVTMTAELADVFVNRRHGVNEIAGSMMERLGSDTRFYAGVHGFVTLEQVDGLYLNIASANWHASIAYLADLLPEGMFVDIGSTTSDLIPFCNGRLLNHGFTDAERMRNGELIYTGVVRTPLMALSPTITFQGLEYHVAAELFATTADVYRITGELMEEEDMAATADGAEKSVQASMRRLARMLCHDREDAGESDWRALAQAFRTIQLERLRSAIRRLLEQVPLSDGAPLLAAGAGRFLVQALARELQRDCLQVDQLINAATPDLRRWAGICFPAHAVAAILAKQVSEPC
ncbi:MAG TPA: hydantoinase/oxoprolinase family protein [Methylophilaceae bacterium]